MKKFLIYSSVLCAAILALPGLQPLPAQHADSTQANTINLVSQYAQQIPSTRLACATLHSTDHVAFITSQSRHALQHVALTRPQSSFGLSTEHTPADHGYNKFEKILNLNNELELYSETQITRQDRLSITTSGKLSTLFHMLE